MPTSRIWTGAVSGDVNVAGNYSPAAVPASGDSLLIDGTAVHAVDANLAALAAVTLAELRIKKSAPAVGTTSTKFQISATIAVIGEDNPDGTPSNGSLVNWDAGAVATNVTVFGTALKGTGGLPPVMIMGSHANNKLTVKGGQVGLAVGFGDTAQFPEIDIVGSGANLVCGSGCTLTTINQTNGNATVNSAFTTLNQSGGKLWHQGSGNAGTVNAGGIAYLNSTGTITAINATGTADLSGNPAARTAPAAGVIPIKAYKGSTVNLNNGNKLSISCTVQPQRCSANEISLITWPDTTMAFS
jgi:hypothetical protein